MKDRNQQLILTLGRIQTKPREPRVEYKTVLEPIAIAQQIWSWDHYIVAEVEQVYFYQTWGRLYPPSSVYLCQ